MGNLKLQPSNMHRSMIGYSGTMAVFFILISRGNIFSAMKFLILTNPKMNPPNICIRI